MFFCVCEAFGRLYAPTGVLHRVDAVSAACAAPTPTRKMVARHSPVAIPITTPARMLLDCAPTLNVAQVESTATLRSNALKFGLTGRAWRFRGTVNYTYAHSMNDVGGSLFRFPADNYNLAGEWGRADFDTRHKFNTLATFNLPGDGIELGTFVTLASGPPFDITTGFDDNGDTEATDRPAGVTRNTGKGPGFAQVDLRLWKKVKLGPGIGGAAEPRELIIRLDAFNVLNRPNYDRIVGVVSSPLFGLPNSARTPRSIQASLRFRF